MTSFLTFLLSLVTVSGQSGAATSWIKPGSGNWDDSSAWSLGVLPNSSQSVLITNSVWKAVAINPSTASNFPDSVTVGSLPLHLQHDPSPAAVLSAAAVNGAHTPSHLG